MQRGDAGAGQRDALYQAIAAFVRGRVRSRADAEDLIQTIYLKILTNLRSLKSRERVDAWAYQIARNVIADHYRARRDAFLEEPPAAPQGSADRELQDEVSGWIPEFLEKLPATYREALTLADVQRMPLAEVARHLGISLSGAKSRVQRARRMLRDSVLACCELYFDRRGRLIDYRKRRRR